MILEQLIKDIKPIQIKGSLQCDIQGVNIDSRRIADGHMFIAVKGTQADGHTYIDKAIQLGAKAILCQDIPESLNEEVCFIRYDNPTLHVWNSRNDKKEQLYMIYCCAIKYETMI